MKKNLKLEHSLSFFVYHFVGGIILVSLINTNILAGLLFFIPMFSYTAISSISMNFIHRDVKDNIMIKTILSLSSLLGVAFAMLINIPPFIYYGLMGFMIGSLLYIIIMDSIPKEKEGNPLFFVIGILFYIIIITMTWVI